MAESGSPWPDRVVRHAPSGDTVSPLLFGEGLPPTRPERLKLWLERNRRHIAAVFMLTYLAFFVACLLTPSAWIDDSVYAALPWWSRIHRALDVALYWMGARWLGQQMRRYP